MTAGKCYLVLRIYRYISGIYLVRTLYQVHFSSSIIPGIMYQVPGIRILYLAHFSSSIGSSIINSSSEDVEVCTRYE